MFISRRAALVGGALTLLSPVASGAGPPIAITAARMLDVRARRMLTPGLVVVQDGKITQVGSTPPSGRSS